MRRWRLAALLAALAFAAACTGTTQPCGVDFCVTDVRILGQPEESLTLLFELTAPDGSIDEANPPTFASGLHITLVDPTEERTYLEDAAFEASDFVCRAGTDIPGAGDRRAAACLLTLAPGDLAVIPPAGREVTISFYSETYPVDLRPVTVP